MELNSRQRRYLEKNRNKLSLDALSEALGVSYQELSEYLDKHWSKKQTGVTSKANSQINTSLIVFILVFLGTILLYANTLDNQFLSDDLAEIVNNPEVGKFTNVINHFYGFTRPLINFLIVSIFGLNPLPFHLVNILFHTGSAFYLFKVANRLTGRMSLAGIATALFLVHPLLSEAVSWISGGIYTQYSFFFLASFYNYLKGKLFPAVILASLALMSHQIMAIGLIPVLVLYELTLGNLRTNWQKLIPYFLIFSVVIIFTLFTLSERVNTLRTIHYQDDGVDNVLILIPAAISSYIALVLWPDQLTLYHSELAFSTLEFSLRLIVTTAYLAICVYTFFKNRLLAFFLIWPLIIIGPTLNPFRMNWVVAERYFYLAGAGVFTTLAYIITKIQDNFKLRESLYLLLALLIIGLSIRTFTRNNDWQEADTLWLAAERTSPSSPNNHNNLGDLYGRRGDSKRAVAEFQTAIVLKPNYADAHHNLGNAYIQMGELDLALESYRQALKFNPNLWQSYQNIAAVYFNQENYSEAEEYIQKAIQVNPQQLQLHYNLGVIYLKMGDKNQAKDSFIKILQMDPNHLQSQQGLIEANK